MRSVKRFSMARWSLLSFLLFSATWSAGPVMAAQDALICPADRLNSNGNICTASDVRLAAAAVSISQQGLVCFPGETIDVAISGTVDLRKGDRFDIGVWVSTDGLPMDLRGGTNGAPDEGGAQNCEVVPLASQLVAVDNNPGVFVIDSLDDAATPQDCYDTSAANNGDVSSGFALTDERDSIINGMVDTSNDGVIDASDTTTLLPVFGFHVIAGALDMDASGTIDASDTGVWNGYAVGGTGGIVDVDGDGSFGEIDGSDDADQNFNDFITMRCVVGPTGKLAFETLVSWGLPSDAGDICDPTNPGSYVLSSSKCSVNSSEVDVDVVGIVTIKKAALVDDGTDFEFIYINDSPPLADQDPNDAIPDISPASPFTLQVGDEDVIFAEIGSGPATIVITETNVPAGWELKDLVCTGDDDVPTVIDLANNQATVTLQYDELNPLSSQSRVECVFTNGELPTLKITKNTAGDNGVFSFTANNGIPAFDIDTTTLNTGSMTFVDLPTGNNYNVLEAIPSGWVFTSASCSNGSGTVVPDPDFGILQNISLSLDEDVTCTFNNAVAGVSTFTKLTVGGDDAFDFLSTDLPGGDFQLTTAGGSSPPAALSLPPGTYVIVEDAKAGWELTDLDCEEDIDQDSTTDVPTRTITLRVQAGEVINCEVINAKHGTLIVEKQTLPDGSLASFEFTGDLAGNLSDGQTLNTSGSFNAAISSEEVLLAGWDLTNIVCTGATNSTVLIGGTSGFVPGDTSIEVQPAAGETVTCVFSNTAQGAITIVKHITETGPATQDFEFASNTFPSPDESFILSPVDAANDAERVVNGLAPGLYDIREIDATNDGWDLVNTFCSDGSPINAINLAAGEEITCTFTNVPIGSTTVVKNSLGGDDEFGFTWGTIVNPDIPENNVATFDLFTSGGAQSQDFSFVMLIDNPYDLTETSVPGPVGSYGQNWILSDIGCVDPTGDTDFDPGQNGSDATVVADSAETVTCTFTNTLDGTLVIRKQTIPDQFNQDFAFTGSTDLTGTLQDYDIAADELSNTGQPGVRGTFETVPVGWALTDISCSGATNSIVTIGDSPAFEDGDVEVEVDVAASETVICTFTNTKLGSLTIVKETVGGNGAFSFNHDVPGVATPFVIDTAVDDINVISTTLLPDTYLVSEVVPTGWDLTLIECSGNTDSTITIGGAGSYDPGDNSVTVDLMSGEDITCTYTNTERASLTLDKTVTNDHGGTAIATDWTLSAAGPTPISGAGGVAATAVIPGAYDLSESAGPAGYTAGSWSCTAGTLVDSTVTLAAGEIATCTIVNDDNAANLALVKSVINDNGGIGVETDWVLSAAGPTPLSGAGGVALTPVSAGNYILTESAGPGGYTAGVWSCEGGSLGGNSLVLTLGETAVCTIVNNDDAPGLTLVKSVTNDNGGTAAITDWTLNAAGPTPISGVSGSVAVTGAAVDAGDYDLTETGGPAGYTAGNWSCTGGNLTGSTVTIASGATTVCTINNDDVTASLALMKTVTTDNGGTAIATDWTLSAAGPTPISGAGGVAATAVNAGVYTLSETGGPSGYTASVWSCEGGSLNGDQLTLGSGESALCTIDNDDDVPMLTLTKSVVNNNGGTAVNTDWTLNAAGPTPISGVHGDASITAAVVNAGVYTLSESGGPSGYTASAWSCVGGSLSGDQLTLNPGDIARCDISNDDDSPALTLHKTVVNDNGGTAANTDWILSATGPTPISGVDGDAKITAAAVNAGIYILSEIGGPNGYSAGAWSCEGGSLSGNQLTLDSGESATCTINNDDDVAVLTLLKTVTNNNGGTAVNTEWTLSAAGPTPISGVDGDTSITAADVDAGVYTLSESGGPSGYTAGAWSCEGGSLSGDQLTLRSGQSARCTINNDDDEPGLTLRKTVVNDNGGTAVNTEWTLSADGPTSISGVDGDASITGAAVDAGVYTLSESSGPDGYTASDWSCEGGSLGGDQLTLDSGESAICTITNDDDAAVITLLKTVTNDNGGTAVNTDWTLSAAGPTPISGVDGDASITAADVDAGVYTLSESNGPVGYTAGAWSCEGGTLNGDQLTLGSGESARCTINNDDNEPGLTLRKTVVNDNGGTAVNTEWTLSADGPTPISGVDGDASITGAAVDAGVYTLSESGGPDGYTAGAWSCPDGSLIGDQLTMGIGEAVVCTITNDDDAAVLTLGKLVVNNSGGTAVSTDWTLNADGPTPISGVDGDASITAADVDAGVYTLSESDGPGGYVASDWSCEGGSLSGDELTLGNGESAVCTITNDDDLMAPLTPVPANNVWALLLLTLMMLATGWYFRPAVVRKF